MIVFNCKVIYYSFVYFVGVVLWNYFICLSPLYINAEPCKTQPKQQTCINTETSCVKRKNQLDATDFII